MKKVKMTIEFKIKPDACYDDEVSKQWFYHEVLKKDLVLWSDRIGNAISDQIKVTDVSEHDINSNVLAWKEEEEAIDPETSKKMTEKQTIAKCVECSWQGDIDDCKRVVDAMSDYNHTLLLCPECRSRIRKEYKKECE